MNHPDYQNQLLAEQLRLALGAIDPDELSVLQQHLEWVELAAGQTLMLQGDPGDAMYLTLSGRLRAYIAEPNGQERLVREMSRGQIIGELSLYTDEVRSATVVAVRDSLLARLAQDDFNKLLSRNAKVSMAITRQIIHRLQSSAARNKEARPVMIALLAITSGVDVHRFSQDLSVKLSNLGRVSVVDSRRVAQEIGQPTSSQHGSEDLPTQRRITRYLDEIEATSDFVLLIGDETPTAWTHRCSRCCDEVLLLADATCGPDLHPIERQCLMNRTGRSEAAESLVLLHAPDVPCPTGTRHWLSQRSVKHHYHIRPQLDRDMGRLARILSGTAIGLVLAGGGARGCAHLGIYQALHEHGIEIDYVGGTSIGAIMAALVASDRPVKEILDIARRAFGVNPTGDFSTMPLISLIAGRRAQRLIETTLLALAGHPIGIEDLWINFYCVASNYSRATEHVFHHGALSKALLASIAIPGALPPVPFQGDLLCDGGTFNNFPVDVMRNRPGIGKVIGVDLSRRQRHPIELKEIPSGWALLLDRLRPRHKRRYRLPTLLAYLMNVTILYSSSRQQESQQLCDIYFNPPLLRVGMLEWKRFDAIVAQGHTHGVEVLSQSVADKKTIHSSLV